MGQLVHDLLLAVLALDEIVHHAAFERAGAVQGHQGDDVLEPAGPELHQDLAHARGFELEHAGGVPAAQQGIGLVVGILGKGAVGRSLGLLGQGRGQVQVLQVEPDVPLGQKLEDVVDEGQGLEAQEVELDQPDLFHALHVELGDHRPGILAVRARGDAVQGQAVHQGPVADDHAGGMGGGVTGQGLQGPGHFDQPGQAPVLPHGLPETRLLVQGFLEGDLEPVGHQLGDAVHFPVRQTQGAPHVPDHRPGLHLAEGDDLGHEILAAVPPGDIPDHLLPAVGAEIHVDIRHGDALDVQEPFEQQLVGQGVQGR